MQATLSDYITSWKLEYVIELCPFLLFSVGGVAAVLGAYILLRTVLCSNIGLNIGLNIGWSDILAFQGNTEIIQGAAS
jgi:hypothetical protein